MKKSEAQSAWPVLKSYDSRHLTRIAMPLGGIGCGSVSLDGKGSLRDWELFNRPSKGFMPSSSDLGPCVLLHMRTEGKPAILRLAEGPIDFVDYEGCIGSTLPNHGLPRFRNASFHCAYPLGVVKLDDNASPLAVRLEAFSPVIAGDADNSSLPVIQLRYLLKNKTDSPVSTTVIANLPNFIGVEPRSRKVLGSGKYQYDGAVGNRNVFKRNRHIQGIFFHSEGVDPSKESWGTIALTTHASEEVSYRTAWSPSENFTETPLLDFYNDLQLDGKLDERVNRKDQIPQASLAVHVEIPANGEKEVVFFLTWHFPNRRTWTDGRDDIVGNWYTHKFADAWDAARKVVPRMPELERKTVEFVRTFAESCLPTVVKEAMLFNVAHLFTETCFRLPDGTFCAWEGCGEDSGLCEGSSAHVWVYEQALAFLFGDLAKTMREAELTAAIGNKGDIVARIQLPLDRARGSGFQGLVAADAQLGCLMKLYREWQLSGDTKMLKRLWPNARKALEYCWIDGSWDADRDGVMEGSQSNTLDVEFYGPNPLVQFWYLGALRAAEEMARYLKEVDFSSHCRTLFEKGSRWTDENLFNGEYYEQQFRLPTNPELIPQEQRHWPLPTDNRRQILDACLVDQTVGQVMSHVCGLGYLAKPANIRKSLRSIMKYNLKESFYDHFNVMRSYALGDESALMMASYPRSERPEIPFPYFTEAMTGFEYAAAVGMLYEGQVAGGLRCIRNIRQRYDGLKRSPFNEAECGSHYARAMTSWAAGLALTGFSYSAVDAAMGFNARDGNWFWSTGYAWGSCHIKGRNVIIQVKSGKLRLGHLTITGLGSAKLPRTRRLAAGSSVSLKLR